MCHDKVGNMKTSGRHIPMFCQESGSGNVDGFHGHSQTSLSGEARAKHVDTLRACQRRRSSQPLHVMDHTEYYWDRFSPPFLRGPARVTKLAKRTIFRSTIRHAKDTKRLGRTGSTRKCSVHIRPYRHATIASCFIGCLPPESCDCNEMID